MTTIADEVMPNRSFTTKSTLLLKLRQGGDDADWSRFFDLYSPLIFRYARSRGCSETLANDVVQETMVGLLHALPQFHYDRAKGRFRSWLLRIVHCRIVDTYRAEQRLNECLADAAGCQYDNFDDLERLWEREWQTNLLTQALSVLQRQMSPEQFSVFQKLFIDKASVQHIMSTTGLTANHLYQHRHRSLRKLRQIINDIETELDGLA